MASSSKRSRAPLTQSATAASAAAHPCVSSSSSPTLFRHSATAHRRVYLAGSAPSVKFPTPHLPTSPRRSLASARCICICSPTNFPGSFRCSLHRGSRISHHRRAASSAPSNRLSALRFAMANSQVRIGVVEGEFVRRAFAALTRPSTHQKQQRAEFRPRPTRLSVMSTSEES